MTPAPRCDACDRDCALQTGRETYPHRPDLVDVRTWVCKGCGARVGCHPGTDRPLGTPANRELQRARRMLHDALLDPLWRRASREKHGRPGRRRALVYKFLAHRLGISRDETHVGMFSLERCRAAWRALKGVTFEDVEAHHQTTKEPEPAA